MSQTKFTLVDQATGQELQGTMTHGTFITLSFDGYGDKSSMPGTGSPVLIELWDGQLRVCLWPDINNEEPVCHSLEGAREAAFKS